MAQLKDLLVGGASRLLNGLYVTGDTSLQNSKPATDNTYNLGASNQRWKEIFGTNFRGLADKATGDAAGNNIQTTYASSFSISDHTITLKNKNGSSLGTVTVPDNNTWRGIQNNLTSDSTTDSLSAAQGKALANGSARDNTKLPLDGGTLKGELIIQRPTTNDTVSYTNKVNPRITFANNNASQALSLVYTDFDSYQAPDSLTLVGNQANSYFIAPNIKATGSFYGALNGNASTATKLATARTISLTGSVTGSGSFDGSGNLSIATTVPTATTSAAGLMSVADKTKLDTLVVGGRNLLALSGLELGGLNPVNLNAVANFRLRNIAPFPVIGGATYCIRFFGFLDYIGCRIGIHTLDKNGNGVADSGWIRVTNDVGYATYTMPKTAVSCRLTISFSKTDTLVSSNGTEITESIPTERIAELRFKIEKGTIPTDWTPAPEDIDNAINKKVDKVEGSRLMTNAEGTKLAGIATGATANVGTITGIKMNGVSKGTSGVVDLGTVLTAHQDISGKFNSSQLGFQTIKVTRSTSISSSTAGYWAAMLNSSQTGAPTLPTASKWWHVLSMDWTGDDPKNWVSQLAIATNDGSGVWWRCNNKAGTNINESTWHRLAEGDTSGNASYANLLTNVGANCTTEKSTWTSGESGTVVWGQRWHSTNYKYTPAGGTATTITDSGDISFFVQGNSTSNLLTVNMAIDGFIKAGSFKGPLTGNASTATTLQNARTINGTSFNGSANITTANWGTARNIYIADSDGTNTGAAVSVNGSANATLKLPATIKASLTGNASTASQVKDSNNSTAISITYSKSGQASTSWLASWNGYELGAISPANITAGKATKLATARSIDLGTMLQGSATFDGSANVTINAVFQQASIGSGNTMNYPWHRVATVTAGTGSYTDNSTIIRIRHAYDGGGEGVAKISVRTNNASAKSDCGFTVRWLYRYAISANSLVIAGWGKSGENVYADVYYKCGTYARAKIEKISDTGGWTLVTSNEANDTTTTDKKTSVEVYTSVADGGTKVRGKAYTTTSEGVDAGIVGEAGTATKLGTATVGSATKGFYLNAGAPTAMTYELKSTVNNGTANQLAYYSGANAISSTVGLTYQRQTGQTVNTATNIERNILRLYGPTYGNSANELSSKTAGVISYGDGGPQIQFGTAATGGQQGAIIFTDHDSAGAGVSWHFVDDQGNSSVVVNTLVAKKAITAPAATTTAAGLMSAADKTKLNGIATNANNYTHPTTSGNKHIPSGGSAGQFLKWSADGTATWAADNNTWRGIQDNLTSSSATDSLSANQGRLLANGSARDSTKLPLAGGTMTGLLALDVPNNVVALDFRPADGYHTTISYGRGGNEALVFATKNAVTSFMFVNGEDSITNHSSNRWQYLTPGLQIKNNCVSIGELIAQNVTPTYKLKVNGASYFNGTVTATTFSGALNGNASTATKLATARTISLTGSVTGSGSFDGSGNLSIATTTNHTHSAATTSAAGLMSAADKTKLNGIADGANVKCTSGVLTFTVENGQLYVVVD